MRRENSVLNNIKQEKTDFEERKSKKSMGRGVAFDERLKPSNNLLI